MSRASIADRGKLSWLLLRRGLNRVTGRSRAHPFLRLPDLFAGRSRLLIAPQDLRTADPTRASEIYAGRFAFAGKVVVCDGRSPFEMIPPSVEWADALLGFGWLRHLRAADKAITRANARALVDEWIALQGSWNDRAWQPEILARRVVAWLSHAPLILNDADLASYRRFLRTLHRQIRYLRCTVGDTRDGVPRLQAHIALTYAALCVAGQERHLPIAARHLASELARQILPDGGHITRNPGALIELMLDLLPLRQVFAARNVAPPPALLNAIDRVMPMLRFFRHGDGKFALFNGMGQTQPDLIATLLAFDDAHGTPYGNAPHSGYQRVEAVHSVLIMDTGGPPPLELSGDAHAGCLSFEFSARQPIIVNCGTPNVAKANWHEVARATAAHSTVTFNDTSSCRFSSARSYARLFGHPIIEGPGRVDVAREDGEQGHVVRASHDGYARRFGFVHLRHLHLSADGDRLDGEDSFHPDDAQHRGRALPDQFAVRFHLHPDVRAERQADGRTVVLVLPNKDRWTFRADDHPVELEESVYLAAPDGARRTLQLVISGHARKTPRLAWSLSHGSPEAPTS
ncbi:MAG: heparinase II/III family protein [Candidatus Eremiobacteraeota bacterium]|nr:heparinase II/III family protein [Candidatus Eremiobacteraeota bacterium]